ncbi:hypothetical protein EMIHUDRAFT_460334 [Emiliania huxleyi CCMP1516]|uniref:Autophagy-related protein 101 n=2 Tax=Emiliania huxleyi TaxID=2903 RepID=A0A0D3IJ68_EMIH1|nr:hypothetical protein EMIHUDRAFT_437602 [Emiliania huxleyi CCMP1516]XP_005793213.1 hypothetical protein EMIHUDRAFT_460334 [Emiliania huxleyi CCMP1516]EOD11303.1 hypothetical protein EMIHUDRAFT_437602 [Emiliania huxleyi CCMP1516]EOD40784.1 hypothetical protein EMIHUDRAFT_460334 [Emiliania huxleyi CCMP1516]|mmetsp:Transcript_42396/g.136889  ORF Transcript_42396/g.136889 Transcript_42396/m.136889 type:complete len:222 (-) Transcript_42396:293-958(-)|eukprot:XP_005763732.1 hypothetical protein EMIHUDRAFT_437602 [Emiliania huxleyi CCMP1516]
MNCEQIALEELHVERFQLKEVLKILLHSIIFQRALGECRLRDVDSELFDISYVRCDSRLVEARVEEHAEAFSSAIERGARVSLAFFERRARQAAFGLFRSEERVVWERWTIPLVVVPNFAQLHRHMGGAQMPPGAHGAGRSTEADSQDEESRRRQASLEAVLRRRIEFILTVASGRREHIPPADGLGGEALWFEISTDADSWSGLDLLKQLLSSPPQLGSG